MRVVLFLASLAVLPEVAAVIPAVDSELVHNDSAEDYDVMSVGPSGASGPALFNISVLGSAAGVAEFVVQSAAQSSDSIMLACGIYHINDPITVLEITHTSCHLPIAVRSTSMQHSGKQHISAVGIELFGNLQVCPSAVGIVSSSSDKWCGRLLPRRTQEQPIALLQHGLEVQLGSARFGGAVLSDQHAAARTNTSRAGGSLGTAGTRRHEPDVMAAPHARGGVLIPMLVFGSAVLQAAVMQDSTGVSFALSAVTSVGVLHYVIGAYGDQNGASAAFMALSCAFVGVYAICMHFVWQLTSKRYMQDLHDTVRQPRGLFCILAASASYFGALAFSQVASASDHEVSGPHMAIGACDCVITSLFFYAFFGEACSRLQLAGIASTCLGILIMAYSGGGAALFDFLKLLPMFGVLLCFSMELISMRISALDVQAEVNFVIRFSAMSMAGLLCLWPQLAELAAVATPTWIAEAALLSLLVVVSDWFLMRSFAAPNCQTCVVCALLQLFPVVMTCLNLVVLDLKPPIQAVVGMVVCLFGGVLVISAEAPQPND